MKIKKQFRTYDVYYNVVTQRENRIKGIKNYDTYIGDRNLYITVTFGNDESWYEVIPVAAQNDTNEEVKAFCKKVNKRLNGTKKRRKNNDNV